MFSRLSQTFRTWIWKTQAPRGPVRLFLTDIDGVLTDGGMYYTEKGDEFKKFQVQDGMGFNILKELGIKTGFVTAESRELNLRRSQKLALDFYYPGEKDKLTRVKDLCQSLKISLKDVAYIGDDRNDLELLQEVGFRACPANARPEIKQISGIYQTQARGGDGAVREWIDLLIKTKRIQQRSEQKQETSGR
ncbi:MAG: KdsC family phosphatase [Bdellovibrionales bacterium]